MQIFNDPVVISLDISVRASLQALTAQVNQACDRAEDAASQGAVVLIRIAPPPASARPETGAGEVDTHAVNQWERALRRMERLVAVTVTLVEDASELGLAVLLASDYRIATPHVRLSLSGSSGEIFPGMVVHRLANQVGVAWSRRLVLFGAQLSAERALELGLIDEIVENPATAAMAFVQSLKRVDMAQLAVRRQLLHEASATSFEDALGTHLAACDRALRRGARADKKVP